jgi:ComF family protein
MPSKQVSLLSDFISLFFPDTCVGCDESLPRGVPFICPSCQLTLPKTENHITEVPQFDQKLRNLIAFKHVLVYMHFQKQGIVQRLMHELKYNHKPEIGELLGRWYGAELAGTGFDKEFDCVVPVPLHKSKLRKRGYNQSEAFAKGLAEAFSIECLPNGLVRNKANQTQTRKSRQERWENVAGLFEVKDKSVLEGKHVLLVDDVLTTGSTLLSCGEAVLEARPAALSFGLIAAAK